jgi:hypothetical protein
MAGLDAKACCAHAQTEIQRISESEEATLVTWVNIESVLASILLILRNGAESHRVAGKATNYNDLVRHTLHEIQLLAGHGPAFPCATNVQDSVNASAPGAGFTKKQSQIKWTGCTNCPVYHIHLVVIDLQVFMIDGEAQVLFWRLPRLVVI